MSVMTCVETNAHEPLGCLAYNCQKAVEVEIRARAAILRKMTLVPTTKASTSKTGRSKIAGVVPVLDEGSSITSLPGICRATCQTYAWIRVQRRV